MTSKHYPNTFTFPINRMNSPKAAQTNPPSSNPSTNMIQSIGGPKNKSTHASHYDPDQINFIHKENSLLRQENRALRRELNLVKGETEHLLEQNPEGSEINDLR